jgi:hypothetical protein
VLARRRRLSKALSLSLAMDRKIGLDDPANASVSRLCDDYGLVYVSTILMTGEWTSANLTVLLDELRRRDSWTATGGKPLDEASLKAALFEGGSALAAQVDADEAAARALVDQQVRADLHHASGDAWRSKQARRGERVLNAGRPDRRIATPAPMPSGREGL